MIRFLVLGFLLVPLAQAALVFEQTKITLEPAKPVAHLDTEFAFKNTGPATVTVTDIKAACGCTVPLLEKKTYAADEQGVLKVRFDVGDRQGPQNRTVTVVADDGASQTLTLIVNLPMRSIIIPRLLLYNAKDTADKTSKITFYHDLPVEITAITSSDPAFTVSSAVEKPGSVYTLTARLVKPESAAIVRAIVRATVLVRSRGASGAVSTDSYYLRYEPAAAGN